MKNFCVSVATLHLEHNAPYCLYELSCSVICFWVYNISASVESLFPVLWEQFFLKPFFSEIFLFFTPWKSCGSTSFRPSLCFNCLQICLRLLLILSTLLHVSNMICLPKWLEVLLQFHADRFLLRQHVSV